MPENKPWESYSNASDNKAPWEQYSNPKPRIDDFSGDPTGNTDKVESAISFLEKDPTTKGGLIDVDKDVLRDVMKNPKASQDQIKESIATMQSGDMYYLKNENGVMVPKQLKSGERPPKGYNVQSVWGTQKDANDDSWYTDLAKSLYNGVIGAAEGAVDLAQSGTMLATGKESDYLNKLSNTAEALKVNKDIDLDKPVYNTEGVDKFSDLVDKNRFDLSPSALWGTLNMAAESVTSFYGGAKGATTLAKLGPKSSAFVGSYLTQLGDNLDNAKEAGLEGRDAAAFASLTTSLQSAIDAQFGLESKIFQGGFKKSANELMKGFAAGVEKDAAGKITEQGFKQLAKETTLQYGKLAAIGAKEIGKDALTEGAQEVGQDFVAKAAENLWDKMDINDKHKFGTDITSAKSFASYIQNGMSGLVAGAPMAIASTNAKKKYNEQSVNAFDIVQKGSEAVDEFRSNLKVAKEKGTLSPTEYDQAMFKIGAYEKYHDQTKDVDLDPKEKKEAFELSFNIEALKSEISSIPKEDLENLDPIGHAKINNKKVLINGLQKELDTILLKQDIQTETKVGQDTVDKVAKSDEPKEDQTTLNDLVNKYGKNKSTPSDGINFEEESTVPEIKTDSSPQEDVMDHEVNDIKSMSRRPVNKFTTAGWNKVSETNPQRAKAIIQEHLKNTPNNEMDVIIRSGKNGTYTFDIGDNKQIKSAQSKVAGKNDFFKYKNLPAKRTEYLDKGGNPVLDEKGEPEFYYEEPVAMKRLDFASKDKEGKLMNKAVVAVYNKQSGEFISFIREHRTGKSSYTAADKYHLGKIYNSNLNDKDLLSKYAHVPKEAKVEVKEVPKVKEIVEKIAKGEPVESKEDLQVYENNKAEIEKELKEKVKKESPKTAPVESKEREVADVKVSKAEKDNLLNEGYDSSTIDKAVKESNDIRKLPAKELFDTLKSKGIFNLGTTGNLEFRPNVGLTAEEYKSTLKQLEKGKETKTAEKLMNFIEDIKETGQVSMIGMTGGKSEKYDMPLHQFLLENQSGERGLSEQEEKEKLAELETKEAYEAQLQKKSSAKGDAYKVLDTLRKNFPKVKVVIDNKIKGAGQVKGNVLSINPGYAGIDTPIHEFGHILIDSIGYNNKVIQEAIKQLKDTDLYKKIKNLYKDLSEEMLNKEVLAEAIGREGAGIFDSKTSESKFKQLLDYIFDKLKQLLGRDKNIAKSLAKQIIAGQGTKNLEGKNEVVQESKRSKMSEEEKSIKKIIDSISEETDLNKFSNEELVEIQNAIMSTELSTTKKNVYLAEVMKRIALNLKAKGIAAMDKQLDEDDVQKDISWTDKWFKVLSHFSESFPEMKEFSKIWNSAYFAKMKESKSEKKTHDKLALDVVNERNKSLGLVETAGRYLSQVISENRHNYFGFLDAGKGKLISLEEAKKKELSKSQIEYLKYTREKLAERQKIKVDIYDADIDVLRMDKQFGEAFKTEGIVSAVGSWLGTGALSNVKLNYTNPETGKVIKMDFVDIQNSLSKYSEKGLKEKAQALIALTKYTIKANRKKVKKGGEYLLDENGNLRSKFDKPVDSRKSYSKDFYGAMNSYIDDSVHIKHISPLIPVVNSIEYLNSKDLFNSDGELIGEKKPNLLKWLDSWKKLHVLSQQEEIQSEIDKALKVLRFMTSAVTMWFNVPANILNVAIGNYNTIRDQSFKEWAIGQKRLFGGKDRKFGALNKYAYDLANKYMVVVNDADSNPIQTGSGLFSKLAYLGQSWGEFQIQSSGLFGLMNEEDFNSFEYKENKHGVEELVVKEGVDEKALEERILANIDKVSDVQGKYSDKDKRNVMNNELGKAALMFKVWIPDAWRVRYGSNGSWKKQLNGGFSEMRRQIKDKGFMEALVNGKDTEETKDFKRNLKGIMATGLLISLVYANDDDDEKSFASKMFQKALSDVLFVFEPENLKFTIKSPSPIIGTVEKLINFGDHLFAVEADDFYKSDSKYGKEGDSKLRGDVMGFVPGKKLIDMAIEE